MKGQMRGRNERGEKEKKLERKERLFNVKERLFKVFFLCGSVEKLQGSREIAKLFSEPKFQKFLHERVPVEKLVTGMHDTSNPVMCICHVV